MLYKRFNVTISNRNSWVLVIFVVAQFFKMKRLYFYLQSYSEADSVVLLEAAVFGIWIFIVLLFVCELGQVCFDWYRRIKTIPHLFIKIIFTCHHHVEFKFEQRFSDSMLEMDNTIVQYDWHLFPYKVRRILPMVMQNTQKPIIIKCFGNVLCARIQMQKVGVIPRGK